MDEKTPHKSARRAVISPADDDDNENAQVTGPPAATDASDGRADSLLVAILDAPSGAHFVRADLHVHTTASHDVTDPALVPSNVVARALAEELSVIAITDHDGPGPFAEAIAAGSKAGLLVLPGVEISTVGGHVLAIFAPDQAVQVSVLLARLNVRDLGGGLRGTDESVVRTLEQTDSLGGLAILAHIDKGKGFEETHRSAAAKRMVLHSRALSGLELAVNTTLYAPGDSDSTRLALLRERRELAATRMRPDVARVRSSDAHHLDAIGRAPDGAPRVTRIKIDTRTFASIRTAFRDPDARIRLEDELAPAYVQILGLGCEGGFLDGLRLAFSSNLTCFVGARGSGKSTVLETIRWVLGRESADFESQDGRVPDSASLYLQDADGRRWRFDRERYSKAESPNEGAVFPDIEVYSQGEIKDLADAPVEKAGDILAFVDRFIEGAPAIAGEIAALRGKLGLSDQYVVQAEAQITNYAAVSSELADIEGRLKSGRKELEEIVTLRTKLDSARQNRDVLRSGLTADRNALDRTERQLALAVTGEIPPNVRSALDRFNAAVREGVRMATGAVERAAAELREDLKHWETADAAENERMRLATVELEKKGLKPDLRLLKGVLDRRDALTRQKVAMDRVRTELAAHQAERTELLADLDRTRVRLSEARENSARRIERAIEDVLEGGKVHFGFGRNQLPRAYLDLLLGAAHGSYRREETLRRVATNLDPSELHRLVTRGEAAALGRLTLGTSSPLGDDVARDLFQGFKTLPIAVHQLQHVGRDDMPRVTFVTPDGTVKPFHVLSQGQRHTVLLSIAFSGTRRCPLLIDQPEDELDNLFVFQHVVTQLRAVKERRQVILVSHNANIVVLGDAELICVMGRGERDRAEIRVRGSIDHPDVRREVLRTLEGGPVAFDRRREMYGLS